MFSAGGFGDVPEAFQKFTRTRASALHLMRKSPLHYKSIYIDQDREETPAMALGTAIHMAVLEPEKFAATYVEDLPVGEDDLVTATHLKPFLKELGLKVSGTKEEQIKNLLDAAPELESRIYDRKRAKHVGSKEVLSEKDAKACRRINQRISDDLQMKWSLTGGHEEMSGWVFHEPTQIVISFQTDYYKKLPQAASQRLGFSALVIDVKKMRDVEPHAVQNNVAKMKMHIQAVTYMEAISALTKEKCGFGWLAVDDKAPYQVAGYLADPATVEMGQKEMLIALEGIRRCTDANDWPASVQGWQSLALPHWYIQREDEPVSWEAE